MGWNTLIGHSRVETHNTLHDKDDDVSFPLFLKFLQDTNPSNCSQLLSITKELNLRNRLAPVGPNGGVITTLMCGLFSLRFGYLDRINSIEFVF